MVVVFRSLSLAPIALAAALASSGCGGDGGGSTSVAALPGERVSVRLDVKAGEVGSGELLSCDLALVVTSDARTEQALEQLDATIDQVGASGEDRCTVAATLDVFEDATPGDYRVLVRVFYTYRGPFGVETESNLGGIRVAIAG